MKIYEVSIGFTFTSICTLIVLLMAAAMATDRSTTAAPVAAFSLIPAQVSGVKHRVPVKKDGIKLGNTYSSAEGVNSNKFDILSDDDSAGDEVVYNRLTNKLDGTLCTSKDATSCKPRNVKRHHGNNKSILSRHGSLPDVHWRAIPMSHLRSHPNFKPLPSSSSIRNLPSKEHVRYFRQESWQWDYLHQGRCTTSQAAAALGFLEPQAAQFLGIPRSLQRGGGGAWHRLRQDSSSIDGLEEMERILCEQCSAKDMDIDNCSTWVKAAKLRTQYPFIAKYIPTLTEEELLARKKQTQRHIIHSKSPLSTRMHWGNAQEATSILTAINYFCSIDERTVVHEVGMCGAGFDDDIDMALNGLKIGASPDAIICHGNGTVEILEVKNHCPFAWNRIPSNHGKKSKKKGHKSDQRDHDNKNKSEKLFSIRDFDLECKVPTQYIPQLMMEMFCVGNTIELDTPFDKTNSSSPICTSAIMIRQTATRGAIVLRLHRDEEWLTEMIHFLGKFKARYVNGDIIPPDNFFWDDEESSRYKNFLEKTKELSKCVEQVAYIDHGRIQRMVMDRYANYETPPLFLDYVEATNVS